MEIIKTNEKLIYTEKGYETLNIVSFFIDNIEYKDYYIKGDLTNDFEKYIKDNLAYITFINNKFIGEIHSKKIIENKYIQHQLLENTDKDKRVLDIYKNSHSLRAEAFLEVFFSTNYVPNLIKYEYVINNKIDDYSDLDNKIKKQFQGKIIEFNKKIKEIENKKSQTYFNIDAIVHNDTEKLVEILIKIEKYLLNLENTEKNNVLKTKMQKMNILNIRKRKEIKKYILNHQPNFNVNEEKINLEKYISIFMGENTIINKKNLKEFKKVLENKILNKQKKVEELKKENKSILSSETKMHNNIDDYLDSLNFDNFYEYIEEGDYIIDRQEFAKKI